MEKTSELPVPRLQIEWEAGASDREWIVWYELIMPLRSHDGRKCSSRRANNKGFGWCDGTNMHYHMGRTNIQGGLGPVHLGVIDTPFRDGAHARWDAAVLKLPVYAVYGDDACKIEE
jgi:hypothetical protein